MAWPRRIYVATTSLGVYYTDDFVDPSTQPTWTAVNTGLAATDAREFWLDPFDPAGRQYVMLEASRTLYMRENGGSWTSILTPAQADTLTGQAGGTLMGFCVNPTVAGRLWVSYHLPYSRFYALHSEDYGASWSSHFLYYGANAINLGSPRSIGSTVWICSVSSISGIVNSVEYSSNNGTSWNRTDLSGLGTLHRLCINPLETDRAYVSHNTGPANLYRVSTGGALTALQNSIPPDYHSMWFHATDVTHQRLIHAARLLVTNDAWATYGHAGTIAYSPTHISPYAGHDQDQMLVGLTIDGTTQPHVIGALYGEADTTPDRIAGPSPGVAPYTDSIPYNCGGLARMGIQAVDSIGIIHTYAVAMPGYTGADRGTPMEGDRASWDADDYDERHASDIAADALVRHTPKPGAIGEVVVSDGTNWETRQLDHDELANIAANDHQEPVTLDADADTVLSLTVQEIGLDDQTEHTFLGGPTAAPAATPTFRALVLADLPAIDLDDLNDVDAAAPNADDVLTWDGADWVAAAPSGGNARALVFSQVADVTVEDTTTETTLLGSGRGSKTIPADELDQGSVIVVVVHGYVGTSGTPNLTVRCDLGGSTICDTGAVAMNDTIYEEGFTIRIEMACRVSGAAGSVIGGGTFEYGADSQHKLSNIGAVGVDTTAAMTVDVTVEWDTGDVLNTITAQVATIEIIKADALAVAAPSELAAAEV